MTFTSQMVQYNSFLVVAWNSLGNWVVYLRTLEIAEVGNFGILSVSGVQKMNENCQQTSSDEISLVIHCFLLAHTVFLLVGMGVGKKDSLSVQHY